MILVRLAGKLNVILSLYLFYLLKFGTGDITLKWKMGQNELLFLLANQNYFFNTCNILLKQVRESPTPRDHMSMVTYCSIVCSDFWAKGRGVAWISYITLLAACIYVVLSVEVPLLVQNLIATKLGVQKITGIIVFDTSEKKTYDPMLNLEVSDFAVL